MSEVSGASQILPYLFIGGLDDAQDEAFVSHANIKTIVNVSGVGYWLTDATVTVHRYDIADRSDADVRTLMVKVVGIIEAAKDRWFRAHSARCDSVAPKPPACLVHCLKGVSRSVTLVVAYLIKQNGWSADDAINFVQQQRKQADPNLGFRSQLRSFEEWLEQKYPSERIKQRQRLLLLLRNVESRSDAELRDILRDHGSILRIERKGERLTCLWFACRAVRRRVQQAIVDDSNLRCHLASDGLQAQIVSFSP